MTANTVVRRRAVATKMQEATAVPKHVKMYALVEGARPRNGARLYAHTHAALTYLKMFDGAAVARSILESLIGTSAVGYHITHKNFAGVEKGIKLTARGSKSFKARQDTDLFDEDMANAFVAMFSKGKANNAYGILKEHIEVVS